MRIDFLDNYDYVFDMSMSDDIIPRSSDASALRHYARKAHADSTRAAYRGDWTRFMAWCDGEGLVSQPAAPETVARYAIHLAAGPHHGHSIRYIRRAMAAIGWAHTSAGIDPPPTRHEGVRAVLAGVAREHGRRPEKRRALGGRELRRLIDACPRDLSGVRDRCLLTMGYFGALRRSELVALDIADIEEVEGGLDVTLRRSKTDQEGQGEVKGVKRRNGLVDPVRLLREWLLASGIKSGPLFRPINKHGNIGDKRLTDQSVALIVKRACERAGLDPERYSGHSLRRGFATSAARGGADGLLIRKQTLHKSDRMVAEYVDEGTRHGRHAQDFIDTDDEADEE